MCDVKYSEESMVLLRVVVVFEVFLVQLFPPRPLLHPEG